MLPQDMPDQPTQLPLAVNQPGSGLKAQAAHQIGSRATGFAVGKAVNIAARTALGAQVFAVTRWLWMAQWLAMAAFVALGILGIWGLFTEGWRFLGFVGLVLAAIAFGIWFLISKVRAIINRQTARLMTKFEGLMQQGVLKASDWPTWYRQHRREKNI